MRKIYILSDGTGRTASYALEAAMVQFQEMKDETKIELFPDVRTSQQIDQIVEKASKEEALIIYSLVGEQTRHYMQTICRHYIIETVDLMGPLLMKLSAHFERQPAGTPGLYQQMNKEYFRRIDAVQFAFTHDDGLRIEELSKAEIVLVGVSRSFKTPLSIYLAYKGWFVANVPIVLDIEPPEELFRIPPHRVFALTTSALELSKLRQTRVEILNGYAENYASFDYVKKELAWAHTIYRKQPLWHIIHISHKSIEEISIEILSFIRQHHNNHPF
ncbi:MAG TPA: pyruvate, water dikinase regulatory protein [Bacteroidales bacterium]|jgi:hypothetical protein|nr:kinase/pyrophosphorylase [Bacteroidales bacterium]MDI9574000.1 pyruvate, water dikinase regulatory protein [Bacteroidota bacterium]OQC60642.1 MAG: putative pyruvate, phosphate dikinase regulatory protein [Bacteroidetes bacterium ADurb.Bin012]MBP9512282.1 kinase/pyrophosphorylase [Bacteroidales bacterium]MBP9588900.1 kinase/pyrophosphorylase [Bacteroidales bacterium]